MNEEHIIELELYIIRHGHSKTNACLPTNNAEERNDPYLTEFGEKQAELLGKRFAKLPLDCVISSGLRRAMRTADAVLKYQPENGAHQMEIEPIFTEWGISPEYPGRTIDEIRKEFPRAVAADSAKHREKLIDYYGDDDDIMECTAKSLAYLRSRFKNGEKVMLVGHGKFNGFLIYSALGIPENQPIRFSLYNTGVTKIVFYKGGTGIEQDTGLVYLNDHSHLLADYPEFSFETI